MNGEFSLTDKRILFIGIGFYDYDQAIKAKLEELGGKVSYICSVFYTPFYRALKSLGLKKAAKKYAERKRKQAISNTPPNHDYIFIIKGEGLTQDDIDLINLQNPNAKSILYFWDDLNRIENKAILLRNFSNVWSFDPEDCKKYGFRFRPLFFRDKLCPKDKIYLISSIGWCHSNRLYIIKQINSILHKTDCKYFLKLFTSYKYYFKLRFVKKELKGIESNLIITKPLPFDFISEIISQSIFNLDIPHPSQKGLSIRTLESLKCGCHILTTNEDIKLYRDISSQYYTILNRGSIIQDITRCFNKHVEISDASNRYSLKCFITELFESV